MTDPIVENAQKPAEVEQDGTRVKQHPLGAQMDAERYAATKTAKRGRSTGLTFFKVSPPGAA